MALSVACAHGEGGEEAIERAKRVAASANDMPAVVVGAGIAGAVMAERAGLRDDACALLSAAFRAAEPEGIARPFLDDADALADVWGCVARKSKGSYAAGMYALAVSRMAPKASGDAAASLTSREFEVMRLAAEGLSVQQIADRLFVSRETVKKHLSNVYSKLGVHGKMQAVAALQRLGML